VRRLEGLGLEDGLGDLVELPLVREGGLPPDAGHDLEPLGGALVAPVVLVELHPVLAGLGGPPRRDHVERETPPADVVEGGGLLRERGREVKGGPHRHHDLEPLGHGGEGGGGAPRLE
jgi:hypothetical protein